MMPMQTNKTDTLVLLSVILQSLFLPLVSL
jgi:hypothetical protein